MSRSDELLSACGCGPKALDVLASLPSMRVVGAKVATFGGFPILRLRLSGKLPSGRPVVRTVTAGMDAFTQIAGGQGIPSSVVQELRLAWSCAADSLQARVANSIREATADDRLVGEARERFAEMASRRMETDRTNLVSAMSGLLASGWTMEMLVSAVNESSVREVMET